MNRKKLRERREALGMDLKDLAAASGVSQRRLEDLERRSNTNPTIDTLGKIADALHCRIADIILDNDI